MKAYLAYVRVSTVRQGERGSSLQEQKSAIEAYAARNGLAISAWYEEMETAAKLGRRQFNLMLAELKKGQAAGVIIHKIDRSARNLKDWAHLGELIDIGLDVQFAHESLDLASRGGRLSADIQAVVAADYIRNLRQEVRKGFYGRLKQGFYPLAAPRGYLDQGKAKAKTIDPVLGPLVRTAFDLYASGNHSLSTLRLEMQRQGLQGKRGTPLASEALATILHNPFYIGIIRLKSGETFQGVHEPLIQAATFERVQRLMEGRHYARPQRHDPFFRRTLKCAVCKLSLIGERQKGRIYYRCHSTTCRGVSVREDYVIDDLNFYFSHLRLSDEELRDMRDFKDNDKATEQQRTQERQNDKKRKLALCEGRLARLTDAFLDGDLEKEVFQERKAALLFEKRGLLDAATAVSDDGQDHILEDLELGNTAEIKAESNFVDDIRALVKKCTSNLAIMGKETVITPRFPYGEVLKWRGFSKCGPDSGTPRNGSTLCVLRTKDERTLWVNLQSSMTPKARSGGRLYRELKYLDKGMDKTNSA